MRRNVGGCKRFEPQLSAYLDGELTPPRTRALLLHLSGCAGCRDRLHAMERLQGALSRAYATPLPREPQLVSQVMAALAREPYRPTRAAGWRAEWKSARPFAPRFRPALTALAMAGMAAIFWSGYLSQSLPQRGASPTRLAVTPSQASPVASAPTFASSSVPPVVPTAPPAPNASAAASAKITETTPRVSSHPMKKADISHSVPHTSAYRVKRLAPRVERPVRLSHPSAVRVRPFRVAHPSSTTRLPNLPASPLTCDPRLNVTGTAETRDDATNDWTGIPSDSSVKVDQRVRSGQDSLVTVSLGDGIELRMNEKTEMVPVRSPQPDAPYWVVQLVRGELFARVPKGKVGLRVLTVAGDALSKEGELIVRTNELFETRLIVAQGLAALENNGVRIAAVEGLQVSSRMGAAPDAPQPSLDMNHEFQWALAPMPRDEHATKRPG